jgi:DNA replication protein DnaC
MISDILKAELQQLSPQSETIPNLSDEYNDVTLSSDEMKEALRKARQEKYFTLKATEWMEKVKSNPVFEVPTARKLYDELRKTKSKLGHHYQVNDSNRNVIHALCLYFANDPRFEQQFPKFSLKKGICLTGPKGTGKTHLMKFFALNPKLSYAIPTCKEIAERFRTNWSYEGIGVIEYYSAIKKAAHPQPFGQEELGFCFGDLGTEDDKNSYGNKMNVMEEIILQRYDKNIPFTFTHFTSNLNAKEIETRYGDRFRDRIKETCNWLVMEGGSFR